MQQTIVLELWSFVHSVSLVKGRTVPIVCVLGKCILCAWTSWDCSKIVLIDKQVFNIELASILVYLFLNYASLMKMRCFVMDYNYSQMPKPVLCERKRYFSIDLQKGEKLSKTSVYQSEKRNHKVMSLTQRMRRTRKMVICIIIFKKMVFKSTGVLCWKITYVAYLILLFKKLQFHHHTPYQNISAPCQFNLIQAISIQ